MTTTEESKEQPQTDLPKTTEEPATTTEVATPSETTSKEAPKTEEKKEELSALAELGAIKEEVEEEPKTEEKKEDKKEESAAEEYEIELDDKSPLTEKDLDSIVAKAEKYNWTKEEAQEYIKEREEVYSRGSEDLRNKAMDIVKAEKEKLLADPDFKGNKLPASLEAIDLVVKKFGDPELAAYLKGHGGNSLPLAKMLLKIGNLMKQDTIQGKGVGVKQSSGGTVEDAYRNMYPGFFKE